MEKWKTVAGSLNFWRKLRRMDASAVEEGHGPLTRSKTFQKFSHQIILAFHPRFRVRGALRINPENACQWNFRKALWKWWKFQKIERRDNLLSLDIVWSLWCEENYTTDIVFFLTTTLIYSFYLLLSLLVGPSFFLLFCSNVCDWWWCDGKERKKEARSEMKKRRKKQHIV